MASTCRVGSSVLGDCSDFASKFDLNDGTTTQMGSNPLIGPPMPRNALLQSYSVPGAALGAFNYDVRSITLKFRLTGASTDALFASIASLNAALSPPLSLLSGADPAGAWYKNSGGYLKWQPDGATSANLRFYQFLPATPISLYDGRELNLYMAGTLHVLDNIQVSLVAQSFAIGASVTL